VVAAGVLLAAVVVPIGFGGHWQAICWAAAAVAAAAIGEVSPAGAVAAVAVDGAVLVVAAVEAAVVAGAGSGIKS